MKKDIVKVHSGCIGQANVALRRAEPPAPKCRCKMRMYFHDADVLVKQGVAKWVVTRRTRGSIETACSMCESMSPVERKTCGKCKGTGKVVENRIWEDYNNDIVLIADDKEGFKQMTPRVATIEEEHIEGAYIYNIPYVLDRIKEYASMIQSYLSSLGAELKDRETKETVEPGHPEPSNDPDNGIGERYDYGRPVVQRWDTPHPQSGLQQQNEEEVVCAGERVIDFDAVPESFYKIGWWKKACPFPAGWQSVTLEELEEQDAIREFEDAHEEELKLEDCGSTWSFERDATDGLLHVVLDDSYYDEETEDE